MGLLSNLSDWLNARYEKRKAELEEQGICPACYGKGFNTYGYEFLYTTASECPSCGGTGSYSGNIEI